MRQDELEWLEWLDEWLDEPKPLRDDDECELPPHQDDPEWVDGVLDDECEDRPEFEERPELAERFELDPHQPPPLLPT